LKADLGRVLLACEQEAERVVRDAQAPTQPPVELSEGERVDALELLRDPGLVDRIVADVGRVGIVGETSNALVAYLAAVSRMLEAPLAVVVQSTSAAGKSALIDAVLSFVPDEDLVRYSAVTGQSLFYMGGGDLAHKVLAVAEEEGASRASYALKLLQSDGRLSIASTGKDGTSGRLTTHTYEVAGPTAIFLTTTAIDIDEELLNRCLVLTVDESSAQTRAIHARQRSKETLAGLVGGRERERVVAQHRNAQRLLDPVAVVNPFAEQLTFADTSTRTRRDHAKYLSLIRVVTFLHQHQRERRTVIVDGAEVVYVESTVEDIRVANRVAHDVLGRSLDELPPQTRRLLELLHGYVAGLSGERSEVRFSRRQVREALGWGDTQLKVHLARLVDLELVVAHRGEHGAHVYELAWDGQGVDGARFVIGLTDPTTLNGKRSDRSGSGRGGGRPPVGARSGCCRAVVVPAQW
jgi:DNA primase